MSTSNDEMGRAPTGGRIVELLLGILLTGGGIVSAQAQQQIAVPRIEQMPNFPQPYALRDWNKTARDFDRFAFDPNRKGDHGPWFWWDKRRVNLPGRDSFAISAYVGMYASNERTMAFDTITCLGAVLGGTLAGINKSSQNGYDWVSMVRNYFSRANEQNLYLNNVPGSTGQTFWYELFPSLLFVEIYSRYPNTPGMDNELLLTADRWREACIGLGARSTPWTLPNFECTAYDFSTGKAVDNGRWKEPDAAAGVAFVEYMAYARTGERKYIDAARWAMGFLDARTGNPFYEVILPFGVYTAARMNAELGYGHDTDKFLNWVLNGDNPRQWGVSVGRWGNHDCSGLLSSIIENEGYAFPMNTFNAVGVIAPMARYDDRYARAIGKWVLNAANASRFFYPDALPDDLQADPAWSRKNDPDNCVAYEGMRENGRRRDRVIGESAPLRGEVQSGSFKDTIYQDQKRQTLIETRPLSTSPLEHIWQLRVSGGRSHALVVVARTGAEGQTFRFSCATNSEGPWTSVFSIDSPREKARWWGLEGSLLAGPKSHPLFLRVESAHPTNTTASVPWSISVDDIYVETVLDKSPYAMGDPTYLGWGATDYGLYGSCFAGMFGALIAPTSVEGILRLDMLATETFLPRSYPTYLYFNPYKEARKVCIEGGTATATIQAPVDIYDAASNRMLASGVKLPSEIEIPADGVILLVHCPAGGRISHDSYRTLCNGVVIDYNNGRAPLPKPVKVAPPADKSVTLKAPRATVEVDGDPRDWESLACEAVEISTAPANGRMTCRIRYAWDGKGFYILAEEITVAPRPCEARNRTQFNSAPFSVDSLGLFLDLDNSNDAAPQGDFNVWFGFSGQGSKDLLTGRSHKQEHFSPDLTARSAAVTSVNRQTGLRVIEARVAWADMEHAVSPFRRLAGDLLKALRSGLRFGCEALLVENNWETQCFVGGTAMPDGRDARSRDILLVE